LIDDNDRKKEYMQLRLCMRIGWIGIVALLLMMLLTASQNISAASMQNLPENTTFSSENNTSTPVARLLNVQGIWNVSLDGTGITVALNQSGDSIFGRCKFEGAKPWNGAIAGSLSGNTVNIAIAAMQGKVLICTDIVGTISDVLQGRYVSFDSNGDESNGEVIGTRISPDVENYTPIEIKATLAPAPASTPAAVQQPQAVQPAQPTSAQQNQGSKKRVQDVTELARGINANVLPWSFPL
jgi:hypothetical protein